MFHDRPIDRLVTRQRAVGAADRGVERIQIRLVVLKLTLVDVFADPLRKPADETDERALDLLEQLAGDVRILRSSVHRWTEERPERLRLAAGGGR